MPPDAPFRVLPKLSPLNEAFWTGGRDGALRIQRCADCASWIHPPQPICPDCTGKNLAAEAVSGRATLATFTVNHQVWIPGSDEPYVIAIVELEEEPRVRLTTNVVECEPQDVRVGMPLRVVFEQREDVWIPLFAPAGKGGA
jgi:uncharacterized OB-fold protein